MLTADMLKYVHAEANNQSLLHNIAKTTVNTAPSWIYRQCSIYMNVIKNYLEI